MPAVPPAQGSAGAAASGRSFGIDAVKGLAVLAVLAQHTVDSDLQNHLFRPVWLDQAVPIFIVLFAFNAAGSFQRSGARRLTELYTVTYLKSRIRRLVVPAVIASLVMAVGGILLGFFAFNNLVVVGSAPLASGAPGDYFIGLIISLALLLPAAWWCYLRAPRTTIVLLVLLSMLQELVVGVFMPRNALGQYLAVSNPGRMGAAVAAGFWLASQGGIERAWRAHRVALSLLAVPSFVYLVGLTFAQRADDFNAFGVLFPSFNLATGVWAMGWTLLLTIGLVSGLDAAGPRLRERLGPLAVAGQASFHLFLVQEVLLGLARPGGTGWRVVAVIASLALGWLAWRADSALTPGRLKPTPAPA